MATTIRVWNQADNRYYTVTVDALAATLDKVNDVVQSGEVDYYLKISTSMRKKSTNAAFPEYVVRSLSDVPAGYAPTTFTGLIQDYIDYFVTQSELGMSTSSSSTSSNSSSSLSSLSSSSRSSISSSSSSSSESSSSFSSSSSSHPAP